MSIGREIKEIAQRAARPLLKNIGDAGPAIKGKTDDLASHARRSASGTKKLDNTDPNLKKRGRAPGQKNNPNGPNEYDVHFEFTLKKTDWPRSRSVHFNRSNEALENAMKNNKELRERLSSIDPDIETRVDRTGGRKNPDPNEFIWNHAHPGVVGGRNGVMELVLKNQHTPGSRWWNIFHPGNKGGFFFWGKK